MKKIKPKPKRNFKLIHQELWIFGIDFSRKRIAAYTKLFIACNRKKWNNIKLNFQQGIIYNLTIFSNKFQPCPFSYHDPNLENDAVDDDKPDNNNKNNNNNEVIKKIKNYSNNYLEFVKKYDADHQNGELVIKIPEHLIYERELVVCIEYFLDKPNSGLYFEDENLFTVDNSPRYWMPCVDSLSELCTWFISVNCNKNLTVISNGTLIEDEKILKGKKICSYLLTTPTCAPNIGLAVGHFEKNLNPRIPEVIYYCHPSLVQLLETIHQPIEKLLDYYEGFLNYRYPYSSYRQVFVNNLQCNYVSYASFSILNVNLLHSNSIIDQVYITRKVLAKAFAEQFFGCFLLPKSCCDSWIVRGIAGILAYNYIKQTFGNNEYLYQVRELGKKLMDFEDKFRPVVLNPGTEEYIERHYSTVENFSTFSPLYNKMHRIKSFLIMRMLQLYLPSGYLHEIFSRMLSNFTNKSTISTKGFIRLLHNISTKNVEDFFNQWVFQGGHIELNCTVTFYKKYLTLCFEQKPNNNNIILHQGSINIHLQEIGGIFKHTTKLMNSVSVHKIFYESTTKQSDDDKSAFFSNKELKLKVKLANKPILWITFDPELELLRKIQVHFSNNLASWSNELATLSHWECKLKYEASMIGQLECLELLSGYRDTKTIFDTILSIVTNDRVFYRVRCAATMCLTELYNKGLFTDNSKSIITLFKELLDVSTKSYCNDTDRSNSFQHYFLRKAILIAFSKLQNDFSICPYKITYEILDILNHYNDKNKQYSDDYYRATLVEALSNTITPSLFGTVYQEDEKICEDYLHVIKVIQTKCIIDQRLPSYKYAVTVACLNAFHNLQVMNYIPFQTRLFRAFASGKHFIDIRKTAIKILVDIVKKRQSREDLDFLFDLIVTESNPAIKHCIIKEFIHNPPFKYNPEEIMPLDDESLLRKMTQWLKYKFNYQPKLRCAFVDLYFILYGGNRPRCLPPSEFSVIIKLNKDNKLSELTSKVNGHDYLKRTKKKQRRRNRKKRNAGAMDLLAVTESDNILCENGKRKIKFNDDSDDDDDDLIVPKKRLKMKIKL